MSLDHLMFSVEDVERAHAFYKNALGPIGIKTLVSIEKSKSDGGSARYGLGIDGSPIFWLRQAAPSGSSPIHLAFRAKEKSSVDDFYRAALSAGGRDNGGPDIRSHYGPNYYAAFVLDPDGNNIEVVCHLS